MHGDTADVSRLTTNFIRLSDADIASFRGRNAPEMSETQQSGASSPSHAGTDCECNGAINLSNESPNSR